MHTSRGHSGISASDIVVPLSRYKFEDIMRQCSSDEMDEALRLYQNIGFVNLTVDAGSVLRSHVTHCLCDIPWTLG